MHPFCKENFNPLMISLSVHIFDSKKYFSEQELIENMELVANKTYLQFSNKSRM